MHNSRGCSAGDRPRLQSTGATCNTVCNDTSPQCRLSVSITNSRGMGSCICRLKGQPRSWLPVGNTELTLVKQQPITPSSRGSTAYIKISTDKSGGGLTNTGYWGVPVQKGHDYQLTVIIRAEFDGDVQNEVRPAAFSSACPQGYLESYKGTAESGI